jgi:hypothetical protein
MSRPRWRGSSELLNHKPELHAGITDFLSECGVNHPFGKSRD